MRSPVTSIIVFFSSVLLFGPAVSKAQELLLPPEFSALYSVKINGIPAGETHRILTKRADGSYLFTSSTRATGFAKWILKDEVEENSIWTADGQNIQPLHYWYHRSGGSKIRFVEVKFDWAKKVIHNTAEGHTWQMPVVDNMLDKLVYQIALMRDMGDTNKKLVYPIADGGKGKDYMFETGNTGMTETPAGTFKTVRLERIRDTDKRSTVFWCAIDLNYLPIRIEHSKQGGHRTTLQLESVTGLGKTP